MPIISTSTKPPSISETDFCCPHCGALAKQFWYQSKAALLGDDKIPPIQTDHSIREISSQIEDDEERKKFLKFGDKLLSNRPFIREDAASKYVKSVYNLYFSHCYNCKEISVWIGGKLCWPKSGTVNPPNPDMPDSAKFDYEEAANIIDYSPRASAALLRLAIQKICIHLGQTGKNINNDIAALVKSGLDVRVQQALDVVRVVGNNAVHPGEIDLTDNRNIAENLFQLVNLIVDIMISQPKHVADMFSSLPSGALEAIKKRDEI